MYRSDVRSVCYLESNCFGDDQDITIFHTIKRDYKILLYRKAFRCFDETKYICYMDFENNLEQKILSLSFLENDIQYYLNLLYNYIENESQPYVNYHFHSINSSMKSYFMEMNRKSNLHKMIIYEEGQYQKQKRLTIVFDDESLSRFIDSIFSAYFYQYQQDWRYLL